MAQSKRPTAQDRLDATRIALSGIARGVEVGDIARELEPLHPKHDTFPSEVLLDLAADALDRSGVDRAQPIEYEGIRERYLSDRQFRGKTQHHRSHYALRAVPMIRAGVAPDLLDEISWWRDGDNDLWFWSLLALVAYTRIAAERIGEPIAAICNAIAEAQGINLSSTGD